MFFCGKNRSFPPYFVGFDLVGQQALVMASSMEHSDEFDFTNWLIKALDTDLRIDANFSNFASNIYESINQFARLSKDELINNFSQLPKEVNQRLRTTLSFEVLDSIGLA